MDRRKRKRVQEKTMKKQETWFPILLRKKKNQKEKIIKAEEEPTIPPQNQISFCYTKKT